MEAKYSSIHQESPHKMSRQSFSDEEKVIEYPHQVGLHSHEGQSSIDPDSSGKDYRCMMLSQWSRERDPVLPLEKEGIFGFLRHFGLIPQQDSPKDGLERFDLGIL